MIAEEFVENYDILKVSELIYSIKSNLESNFYNFMVRGEISNLSIVQSGHCYFTLKDESAQIRCALFKSVLNSLSFDLKNGDEVEIKGRVSIYSARGELQVIVLGMKPFGYGKLFIKYELLKNKLTKEGFFDDEHKKAIPKYPNTIGIITSPTSAAIRDVISTLKRRMPSINIIIYPTMVQGLGSENEIVNAINLADKRQEVDTLIICRGGGSIEDLWAFNEEVTVRAIFNCRIPTIVGVGHQTDTTLSDFVSDKRAPTPTGAAEMASPNADDIVKWLKSKEQILNKNLTSFYYEKIQRIDYAFKTISNISSIIQRKKQDIYHLKQKLLSSIKNHLLIQEKILLRYQHSININISVLNSYNDKIRNLQKNLNQNIQIYIINKNNKLNNFKNLINNHLKYNHNRLSLLFTKIENIENGLEKAMFNYLLLRKNKNIYFKELLEAYSPQNVLNKGFSIVTDKNGNYIKDANTLKIGDNISIRFAKGKANAMIKKYLQDDLFN